MLFGLSFRSWPVTALAVFTLVMSAAYMLRLFHKIRAREADVSWRPTMIERTCIALLAGAILWFGVAPGFLAENARSTAKVMSSVGSGVNR